jgi:hypothetical protein
VNQEECAVKDQLMAIIIQVLHFIQRLHTVGGIAPSDGCRQASAGSEVRVSYSAEYWFYVEKP